ncbi:hypothetical protein VaNZ11_017130, partial [Volvox africanus]
IAYVFTSQPRTSTTTFMTPPAPQLQDNCIVPIGLVHILVSTSHGLTNLTKFIFGMQSLLFSNERDDKAKDITAFGARSTELLTAVGRLEANKLIHVIVKTLVPAPPAANVTVAKPPAAPTVDLPELPLGVSLLELTLHLPRLLWTYDESGLRKWLQRERKAMVTVLGALVPLGSHHEKLVQDAVRDLLEQQPPGGDRERYSLISCFRELPSVTRRYDRPICSNDVQCLHGNHTECRMFPNGHAQAQEEGQQLHYQRSSQRLRLTSPSLEGNDGAPSHSVLPVLDRDTDGPMLMASSSPGSSSPPQSPILGLPADVLEDIMSRLDPLDLARLRATCRTLEEAGAAGGVVPGVRLTLFPHQRAAIRWMIQREWGEGPTRGSHRAAHTELKPIDGVQVPCKELHTQHGVYNQHKQNSEHHDDSQANSHHNHISCHIHNHSQHPHCAQLTNRRNRKETDKYFRQQQEQQQQEHDNNAKCYHKYQKYHQHRQPTDQSPRNPVFLELVCGSSGELMLWADVRNGELHTVPPPGLRDVRGGFFCDEPGLGKTITALSLILKTLGQLPAPPAGATVEWVPNREGRRVGFYTLGGSSTDPQSPAVRQRHHQQELQTQQRGKEAQEADAPAAAAHSLPHSPTQQSPVTVPLKRLRSGTGRRPARTSNTNRSCSDSTGGNKERGVRSSSAGTRRTIAIAAVSPAAAARSKRKRQSRRSSLIELKAKEVDGDSEGSSGVGEERKKQKIYMDEGEGEADECPQQQRTRNSVGSRRDEEHELVGKKDDEEDNHELSTGAVIREGDSDSDFTPGRRTRRRSRGRQHQRIPVGTTGDRKNVPQRRRSTGKSSSNGSGGSTKDSGRTVDGRVEDEKEEGGDSIEATWVQCDQCRVWRKLPEGTPVPGGDNPWFCHMHPLSETASCTAPSEAYGEMTLFGNAPGYVRLCGTDPAVGGDQANVEYFKTALRAAAARLGLDPREIACMEALRWLVQQDPVLLLPNGPGAAVPVFVRQVSHGYDTVFQYLDLMNVADAGGAGRNGLRRRRHGSGPAPSITLQHTWRSAPYMAQLLLDTKALAVALTALRSCPAGPCRTYLSAATLVVLPATLIDHWLLQIRTHVVRGTLRVCVLDRIGPRVALPPSSLAWDYDIVITTFQHLSLGKATHGSAAAEWAPQAAGFGGSCTGWLQALLQVHWLRVVLDEGHLLGASTTITNKLQAACRLTAERRWVMTGTPTPVTHGSSAAHLQPLLAFLHHEPYGSSAATWQAAVQRPLEACRPEGRRRLMQLLRETMIRASKADLLLLPRLVRTVTLLDFEPQHAKSYNELVEVVRRNLLTSDWLDESHSESLLNRGQGRWSRQMMSNVWFSCCVAGSTNSVVKEEDLVETLQLLSGRLGLPPPGSGLPGGVAVGPPWLPEEHPLREVEEGLRHGAQCQICSEFVRQPMVTPCGHLACLDCTASDRERCPLPSCRTPYVMQAVDDPARRKHNRSPKWPVPQELIEWQPVFHQSDAVGIGGGSWSANWQLTRSSKISHMLTRLREVGAAPPPSQSSPPPLKPTLFNSVGDGDGVAATATTAAAADGIAAPSGREAIGGADGGGILAASAPRRFRVRTKAIVFTQYGVHMQLIESSLMKADISFVLLTQVIGKEKRDEGLSRFQHDPQCGVLVMDQLGAVGLDLSFVSYILLMEPLADFSLEQQVVSRAHRMGAKKTVEVETLVMKGSAEEALLKLDKRGLMAHQQQVVTPQPVTAATATGLHGPYAAAASAMPSAGIDDGGVPARQRRGDTSVNDPRVSEDLEGGVQVDRRALRNQLFLLMEKVRLGPSIDSGRSGGGGGGGGGGGQRLVDFCEAPGSCAQAAPGALFAGGWRVNKSEGGSSGGGRF